MKLPNNICMKCLDKADLLRVAELCKEVHFLDAECAFVVHMYEILESILHVDLHGIELVDLANNVVLERSLFLLGDEEELECAKEPIPPYYDQQILDAAGLHIGVHYGENDLKACWVAGKAAQSGIKAGAPHYLWMGIIHNQTLLGCFFSPNREFTKRELAILSMLQPHIELAWSTFGKERSLKEDMQLCRGLMEESAGDVHGHHRRQTFDCLSPRQRQVTKLVADGMDNQQIADKLGISVRTVQKHLELVFQAIKVLHRTELAAKWHRAQLSGTYRKNGKHEK